MNEDYQADFAETTESSEVTTSDFASAFDDAWDSDGYPETVDSTEATADEAGGTASEADQQEEAETAEDNPAEKAAETEADKNQSGAAADQRFTIKAFDETKELDFSKAADRDEAISLMQKGMGFDNKVSKLNDKIAEYEEFLTELAQPLGMDLEQLMDSTRARLYKVEQEKAGKEISETDALFKVQRDRAAKKNKAEQEAQQSEQAKADETKKKSDEAIKLFVSIYPDVKPNDIPQSVWEEVSRTGDLVGAYTRHENARLKAENEALRQNKKNAERSTGSSKTAGSGVKKSAFDEGWDDI